VRVDELAESGFAGSALTLASLGASTGPDTDAAAAAPDVEPAFPPFEFDSTTLFPFAFVFTFTAPAPAAGAFPFPVKYRPPLPLLEKNE